MIPKFRVFNKKAKKMYSIDGYIYFKRRTARPLQVANYRITDTVKQDTKAA
ncbi:hypothetical protein SAG0037_07835 [Streptococcus agalactiae FSL S3-337]|nr:hypothetical protein SAG0037_07835 [Streptococcus agalactiae FSL S3-337]EPT49002.1 hypothetical protein SAG0048_01940 [Streptococcus agalactiae FSL S3-003]EPT52969.1 hypothetical protein SAG0051_04930 [Streptococcus agalactiae CCUG 19094]EPT57990.1 hypothetical protein SAG0060_00330 [Streptococcus agalactiae CCUG 37737]EPU02943.1 hypothetical protein SAG0110_03215 [Streptococcus agalactiae BSU167]EPU44478.1 hypothetical protein SAG0194_02715 [Streptococcus agalactiae str. Gottschalk 1003A]